MHYLLRLFQHMELTWGKRPFGYSSYIPVLDGREVHLLYLMVRDEEGVRWRRELRTSCCGQWWAGSCVWQLMNQVSFGGSFGGRSGGRAVCSYFYLLLFLSNRLSLLLFSLFPLFTPSYSFSNQTILAEWLFVMQRSAGRRVVCSARGGLSRVCYAGTLYPSNEGNPLVFWWIALTSALDCIYTVIYIYTRACSIEVSHSQHMLMQLHKIPIGKTTKVLGNIKLPPTLNFTFNWEDQQRH